jgi:YD repeat-containing protein
MAGIAFRFSLTSQSNRFKGVHWFYWWAEPTLPGSIRPTHSVGTVFAFNREWKIFVTETGFRWQDQTGNWSEHDASGRLLVSGNRNGMTITYGYDDSEINRGRINRGRTTIKLSPANEEYTGAVRCNG